MKNIDLRKTKHVSASNFKDAVIFNPDAKYGSRITQICSYFYEQNDENPNPTDEELLQEVRNHFKDSEIKIAEINDKIYQI